MIYGLLNRNDHVIDENGKEYVFLEYVMGTGRTWCHARPILTNDSSSEILLIEKLITKKDLLKINGKAVVE